MKNIIIIFLLSFLFNCKKEIITPITSKTSVARYNSEFSENPTVLIDSTTLDSIKVNGIMVGKPIIAIYGTSIDHGTHPSIDSSWVNVFKKAVSQDYNVVNYGVYNRTYMDSTYFTIWGILKNTKNAPMDIIVLGGPTNDAQNQYFPASIFKFKRDYKRVIDSLQLWHPEAKIILNTAIKSKSLIIPQHRLDTMINLYVRKMGLEYKLKVCNMASLSSKGLSPDGIHPSGSMYVEMGTYFYNWFYELFPSEELPTNDN
jgi:hypothetical protein